jgi:predicted DNA repair protein MutK
MKLSSEENELMHLATKRVHLGLQNCFEGTKAEKVLDANEKEKKKEKVQTKKDHYKSFNLENTCLLDTIMSSTSFTLGVTKTKKK